MHQRHERGAEQGLRDRIGVGPHEAARTQFHAAEVAHHGRERAFDLLVAQHFQHRPAGRATGFAVVVRGRLAAGHQGPAHVRSRRVFGTQRGNHDQRGRAIGHRLHAADEAALLDEQLAVNRLCKREAHPVVRSKGFSRRRART